MQEPGDLCPTNFLMKKKLASALLALAVAASLGAPATAAKRKKKGPKPYHSEEVTIQVGHSALYATSGEMLSLTGQEFMRTCAIPQSNGFDGYVFEIPAPYRKIKSTIQAFGEGGSVDYDIDMFAFGEDCSITTYYGTDAEDEMGVLEPGTAYVMLLNFGGSGAPIGGGDAITAHFSLKPGTKSPF